MKKLIPLLWLLSLTGCPEDSSKRAALETQLQIEQQQRARTEAQLAEQTKGKFTWQILTCIAIGSAAVLLVVGAALGSKAREDASEK